MVNDLSVSRAGCEPVAETRQLKTRHTPTNVQAVGPPGGLYSFGDRTLSRSHIMDPQNNHK